MNYQLIEAELNSIATTPGIIACALVAVDTGMIYFSSSSQDQFVVMAEGARDYWALHHKNGQIFDGMGNLNNIFVQHERGILRVQLCGETMLLITLAKLGKTDWTQWPSITSNLHTLIKDAKNLR